MAQLRCGNCREDREIVYRPGAIIFPRCGSSKVRLAVRIEELLEDDALWAQMDAGEVNGSSDRDR